MAEFDDFVVQITPCVAGEYGVVVISSPAGGGRGVLSASLLDEVTALAVARNRVTRDGARERDAAAGRADPKYLGGLLFSRLFAGQVGQRFNQSYGATTGRGRRLRVRIQLNIDDASVAALATLPWELMYREAQRDFLALSGDTTVVRELVVGIQAYEPKPIVGPLHVLFVMADPTGHLDLERERREIERKLAEFRNETVRQTGRMRRDIRARFLPRATFVDFEADLTANDYHIIHFMGHGTFDTQHRGELLFHDRAVAGEQVAQLLRKEKMTRLVTLNACRTAELSPNVDADPFAGVASAIVMAGIPAVVAMQLPVSDEAAIAFAARLYSQIERGASIEDAVDSGRQKMMAIAPEDREWATPVLFLRGGETFTITADEYRSGATENIGNTPPGVPVLVPSGGPREPWAAAPPGALRVFIAATTEKYAMQRQKLRKTVRELAQVYVEMPATPVFDSEDAADLLAADRAYVRRVIQGADLCVHLLGDTPGAPFDEDDALMTYPVDQLRAVLESERPVLVLIPDDVVVAGIADAAYRAFLDELKQHYSETADQFEVVQAERSTLAAEVVAKVERLRSRKEAADPVNVSNDWISSAFVDAHREDLGHAQKLQSFLVEHGNMSVDMKVASATALPRSPSMLLSEVDRVLTNHQLYVIISGRADGQWVEERFKAAWKSAALLDAKALVAVYRPSAERGKARFDIRLNTLPMELGFAKDALKAKIEGLE